MSAAEAKGQLGETLLQVLGTDIVGKLHALVEDTQAPKHERAALIVSQVAQPRHIPALIELLGDVSPRVCEYAELGLERLTGRSGPPLPTTTPLDPVAEQQRSWQQWWAGNKHLYPRG